MSCDNRSSSRILTLWLSATVLLLVPHSQALPELLCGGMDIRNDPKYAQMYTRSTDYTNITECTVMEGDFSLSMVTNSNTTAEDFPVFSSLREINGYVLIFQVAGLDSLGRIFPNLRIIRGRSLLLNYALVVYQNADLKEIGLSKLAEISKGGVRIAENSELCYTHTINWDSLFRSKITDVLIEDNNDVCMDTTCTSVNESTCEKIAYSGRISCWNSHSCLKRCDKKMCPGGCLGSSQECCHDECAGGCIGPTNRDCLSCRHVWHNGSCIDECPFDMFLLLPQKRRCVSEHQCLKRMPEEALHEQKAYWKPINRTCSTSCPPGYIQDENDRHKCKECTGWCPKECKTVVIDAIGHASKAKGCNIIAGDLVIRLHTGSGENSAGILEEALADLHEVEGHVAIFFSPSLVSLHLLKNLKRIRGNSLYTDTYALSVFENENLRLLFPENHTLIIDKGKVQFHNNPQLCYRRIVELIDRLGPPHTINGVDVSEHSNGNKAVCEEEKLNLSVLATMSHGFVVEWDAFNTTNLDHRKFLGYQIFYKAVKGPDDIIDIDSNRDACYDSWQMEFESASVDDGSPRGSMIGSELSPNTWYAVYVRTLLVNHPGARGGISDLVYVRTAFAPPSSVRNLQTSKTTSTITFSWEPPMYPKGDVTHYKIEFKRVRKNDESLERNFCLKSADLTIPKNPKTNLRLKTTPKPMTVTSLFTDRSKKDSCSVHQCCECNTEQDTASESVPGNVELREKREKIEFENAIHNKIFYQRCDVNPNQDLCRRQRKLGKRQRVQIVPDKNKEVPQRRKRSVEEENNGINEQIKPLEAPETDNDTFVNPSMLPDIDSTLTPTPIADDYETKTFNISINETTVLEHTLTKLKHYSDYVITVWACQNESAPENFCSDLGAWQKERTEPIPSKDKVTNVTLSKNSSEPGSLLVRWKPLTDPNGFVFKYMVEAMDVSSDKPILPKCITPQDLARNKGLKFTGLWGGHWTVTVWAHTTGSGGKGPASDPVTIEIESQEIAQEIIILIGVLIPAAVIIVVVFVVWYCYRRKMKKLPEYLLNIITTNPDYISTLDVYQPDQWELARDDIELLNEIGHGTFGKVFAGRGKNVKSQCGITFGECAIKTVGDSATHYDRLHFLVEASVMKSFNTAFIVKLYGVVSNGQPALVVMEMMDKGNLRDYLRSRRPDSEDNVDGLPPPTLDEIYTWAGQVADGMAYLEHQKFCHRDLAARNCMVAADDSCKIGDFGMARDVYVKDYYRPTGKRLMPVRWMGPESLKDAKFTSKSDVWSYGVVLWETVTLAQQPYPGLSNEEVFKYIVESSGTMASKDRFNPSGCPEQLLNLMKMCWKYDPRDRPSFAQLVEIILPNLNEDFRRVSFYCNQDQAETIDRKTTNTFRRGTFGSQKPPVGGGPTSSSGTGIGQPSSAPIEGSPSDMADSDTPLNPEGTHDSEVVALNVRGGQDSDGELSTPVCSYNRRTFIPSWSRKQSPIGEREPDLSRHVEAVRALSGASNTSANGHVQPVPV